MVEFTVVRAPGQWKWGGPYQQQHILFMTVLFFFFVIITQNTK
jgi:hypothetical protein